MSGPHTSAPANSGFSEHFVYLIAETGDAPMVKIGVAINPKSRLDQLQTGNPRKLILHRQYGCPTKSMAHDLERISHEKLSSFRLKGEWFNCAVQEARWVVKHYWFIIGAFEPTLHVVR